MQEPLSIKFDLFAAVVCTCISAANFATNDNGIGILFGVFAVLGALLIGAKLKQNEAISTSKK